MMELNIILKNFNFILSEMEALDRILVITGFKSRLKQIRLEHKENGSLIQEFK